MKHIARKRFGQNFLRDQSVIERIVQAIHPQADDVVVEIGPGLSALTLPLSRKVLNLQVVEIDRDLAERLSKQYSPEHVKVIQGDALSLDFSTLGAPLRVVGNLPYNISTPLLFHLLNFADGVQDQHFMLQREVVDRLVAKPGSKVYGRLSVMLQQRYSMEKLFDVPPEAFDPQPSVTSAIVRMQPLKADRLQAKSPETFAHLVTSAFGQRRKMLRKSLGEYAKKIDFDSLGIAPTARAEELTVSQFVKLSDACFDDIAR